MLDSLGRDWTRSPDQRTVTAAPDLSFRVNADASDAAILAQINAIIADPEPARLAAIDQTIAADATVQQLRAMDTASFDAWWAANVTNLAQANNILKRLTRLVLRRLP